MAVKALNPKAEVARAQAALAVNISAARGLQDVLRTNLGPKGTMKMLVSGAGDIKLTKDGNVLLQEMQIQHPTASLIAKVATAQDDITGDGTTSNVLIIGELLKQADLYISEGLHPRIVAEGFEIAKEKALEVLEQVKVTKEMDRETLIDVARTSLRTKVHAELADILTEAVVDSVLTVRKPDEPIDLYMVEIMEMKHKSETDTTLIRGLVLDHGARHPDMKKRVEDAYILTCNVSLEYEKTEVSSGFFYKSAEEREKLVKAERKFIEDRVKKIIDLKRKVCGDSDKGFVVINQKGIDPFSLDALAKEGIVALRRAKRRNMERLTLACGGTAMNSVEDLTPDCLGHAGLVYEYTLVLAQNSGYDPQETLVKVQTEHVESGQLTGVDLNTGEPMVAAAAGIWDNYNVKKQLLHSWEFVREKKYKTEAEAFGWSFVFEDFVSEELKKRVTQKLESAPWWLPIEKAFWRQGDFPRGDTAEDGYHGVSPVTAFPPQNSYGLYDLLGNTWEWTASEFRAPGQRSRQGAQPMQVLRGASWIDTADGSANHRARVTTR
ncbi:T-complex protein 1 subunit zeta [Willisornis vidua]|uniref:T-complex protein 1 subunit zeta n=1 Tax=Willisornis vidua TaxID=1566151 RepID=A0ABQ9CQL5_9PASS|nr:T-complex protein 1 subunit zeta [Willisornis vidua]